MAIIIIKRHFDTIVKHCRDTYPSEAGGFLGGKGNIILGIFPVPNVANFSLKSIGTGEDREVFSHSSWDIIKVTEFFKKYDIDLIGLYHSHPNRELPIPSKQDLIAHRLENIRIMMIVSLTADKKARVAAYETAPGLSREKLTVVRDEAIHKYLKPYLIQKDIGKSVEEYLKEMKKLEKRIGSIISEHGEKKRNTRP